jgi:hypothetical protein
LNLQLVKILAISLRIISLFLKIIRSPFCYWGFDISRILPLSPIYEQFEKFVLGHIVHDHEDLNGFTAVLAMIWSCTHLMLRRTFVYCQVGLFNMSLFECAHAVIILFILCMVSVRIASFPHFKLHWSRMG